MNRSRWIPVDKELPEKNKHVLLFLKNGDKTVQMVGYLFFNDMFKDEYFDQFNGEFAAYSGGSTPDLFLRSDILEKEYVVAWQPLPKPYEQRGE